MYNIEIGEIKHKYGYVFFNDVVCKSIDPTYNDGTYYAFYKKEENHVIILNLMGKKV